MSQIFESGQLLATPGVAETFSPEFMAKCHERHIGGDWGDIDPHDVEVNLRALENGARLMSVYTEGDKTLWVITEADRSSTTYLLPEEY